MTIGQNQLNIHLFEVGMVISDPNTGSERVVTLAVHPMVVAPETKRYGDSSRSAVDETASSTVLTRNGRSMRPLSLTGTFGVETRGVGTYIGTGDVRFQRFYNEVVRLPDAINRAQVDAILNSSFNTPGLVSALVDYDPRNTRFYVNWYDFWDKIYFEVVIANWDHRRQAKKAAASGAIWYSLQGKEAGPLVAGSIADNLLGKALNGLSVWRDVNEILSTYTVPAFLNSTAGALIAAPAALLTASVGVAVDQVESATGVVEGSRARAGQPFNTPAPVLTDMLNNCIKMAEHSKDIIDIIERISPRQFDQEVGQVNWTSQAREGEKSSIEFHDALSDLITVQDAGEFQRITGAWFGMGQRTYQEFLSGSGGPMTTNPDLDGSIEYTVTDSDTDEDIARRFGVSWERILDVNGLLPDEALFSGTLLRIPTVRAMGPDPIEGLPVFDSHLGKRAWGRDIAAVFRPDADGDFEIVIEEEVLIQGIDILIDDFAEEVMRGVEAMPDTTQAEYVAQRLRRVLSSDPRIASVGEIEVVSIGNGFETAAVVTAINGGTIRTGGNAA